MLIYHGVDDVDEWFVAVEKTMPAGENITLEPAFTGVLAEHFHHTAIECQVSSIFIFLEVFAQPYFLASFVNLTELVGLGLIGAEDPEVFHVLRNNVSEEGCHVTHARKVGDTGVDLFKGILPEIWHIKGLTKETTVSDRIGTHSGVAFWSEFLQLRNKSSFFREDFLGLVASHPLFQDLQVCLI